MKLFLERYGDILDEICGDIDSGYNDSLLSVMSAFGEPTSIYPNRYDNFSIKSTAFDDALNEFNGKMNTNCHMGTK